MKLDLNFEWQFIDNYQEDYLNKFPEKTEIVNLPHTNKTLPINYFDEKATQFVSSYQKFFSLPEKDTSKRYFFVFDGIMLQADIYLNGHFLGHFISGYLPIEVEATAWIKEKKNRLVVIVDAHEDPKIPPFGGAVDYLPYGGIYREVHLESREKFFFRSLHVSAGMDGHLEIRSEFENPTSLTPAIHYELFDGERRLAVFNGDHFVIPNPHLWTPEDPHFYFLKGFLSAGGIISEKIVRFGFRSAIFRHNGFFLNGKRLKLIGLNRHQSFPYIGNAASKSLQEFDADRLHYHLGLNIVRCSHYPPSIHFLNRCDEIGLLVIDEVPGWQHIGEEYAWRTQYGDFLQRTIDYDFNHPSVILRSIRINESADDHALYAPAQTMAHQLDPKRQTTGVRNFTHSELLENVYAFNDFSHTGKNAGLLKPWRVLPWGKWLKPFIVTENNGHMFPSKSFDDDSHRLEQAKRHLNVLEAAYATRSIDAMLSWCYSDYQTHQEFGSGDHICYHGVSDFFRQDKYAAATYRSQLIKEPVLSVLSNMNLGDYPEAILPPTYVLTNCDFVRAYKNEKLIGDFYPDKKHYPHLPHPPVIISHYVTEDFDSEERFNINDRKRLKKILGYAGIHGFNRLTVGQKTMVGVLMLKYHLHYDDLVDMWNKYVSNWGSGATNYRLVGYRDQQPVISQSHGAGLKFHLELKAYRNELIHAATYDTAIISVQLLDQFNVPCTYAFTPIEISTSANLCLIGPSIQNLSSGSLTLFAMTKEKVEKTEEAFIQVKSSFYGTKKIKLIIK